MQVIIYGTTKTRLMNFVDKNHCEAYLNAANVHPQTKLYAEEIDFNKECSGLSVDPRCTGRWCFCRV